MDMPGFHAYNSNQRNQKYYVKIMLMMPNIKKSGIGKQKGNDQ